MTTDSAANSRRSEPGDDQGVDASAPLDLLLSDAGVGMVRRFIPGRSTLKLMAGLAKRPEAVRKHATDMVGELAKIAVGRSDIAPAPKDRRFSEPAWENNAVLKRLLQTYLTSADHTQQLLDEAGLTGRDAERMKFVVDNVVDAAAPSNNPLLNPLWWKALIDSGGKNVVEGARNLLGDASSAPRVPTMVDSDAFQVGKTLAVTPGSVVFRSRVLELIQYTPTTPKVGAVPLLIVPPVINKYYIVDLAPGRSMIEYLVDQGQQVFTISWRNPDARHRKWGFDTYGGAIEEAMDAVASITGADATHLLNLCSGGALASMLASHLADIGTGDRVASFSLAVAVLDQGEDGTVNALADERTAKEAVSASAKKGYLDGSSLAEVFAWLRPNDLIWNYWVNNYLQGRRPAAFDILYWNADTTRMTAALHRDFVELFSVNGLSEPDTAQMLGSPVDLSKIDADSYIVAGVADHICPWHNCYGSTLLLGGKTRFVLSSSGHVACLVNPPGNPKASYRVGPQTSRYPRDADKWLESSEKVSGTWWEDYARWLADRNRGEVDAPAHLGDESHPPLEPAPGTYVFDQ